MNSHGLFVSHTSPFSNLSSCSVERHSRIIEISITARHFQYCQFAKEYIYDVLPIYQEYFYDITNGESYLSFGIMTILEHHFSCSNRTLRHTCKGVCLMGDLMLFFSEGHKIFLIKLAFHIPSLRRALVVDTKQ